MHSGLKSVSEMGLSTQSRYADGLSSKHVSIDRLRGSNFD